MRATVQDAQALKAIRPLEMVAYLRASGWREERQIADKASIWVLGDSAGVAQGVSANLCDALVGMAGGGGLEVSLSWARTRLAPAGAPPRVLFPPDAMPVIEEAARMFRAANPEPLEVHGYVVRLRRAPDASSGEITVLDDSGERPRSITVPLDEPDYSVAVNAHRDGIPVTCCGDLIKEGGSFRLRNHHRFALAPEG